MSAELSTKADPGRFETALPIATVKESKTNPRRDFEPGALQELADSIRTKGLLQPILVRPLNGGTSFELVCGTRRLRAARLAGLDALPASVRILSDQEVLEIQVIENLQRQDLHALEEARGYQQLLATKGYDVARIAERVGRSVKYVYDRVKLLSLTKQAQDLFLAGKFSAGHAILLARLSAADQARCIDPDHGGLFEGMRVLPYDGAERGRYAYTKPVSVRELEAWVDRHVKVDREAVDPMLFPEAAAALARARDERRKIVPIMNLTQTPYDAQGPERIYSETSWKRADGQKGKICDRPVLGIVSIGPGRNEALQVCIAKDTCAVHWADRLRAKKQRQAAVTKAVAKGEDPRKAEKAERERQEAARLVEEARWQKAQPAIWSALAEAVKKAPTRAGGLLAETLLRGIGDDRWMYDGFRRATGGQKPEDLVPRGKTTEDLVRHAAFLALVREAADELGMEGQAFAIRARAFNVDVQEILDRVAPKERSCRFCGCTEKKPCAPIPGGIVGGPCAWISADVCSRASCETKLQAERKGKGAKKSTKKGGKS